MKRSTNRILTTHIGSLAQSPKLYDMLQDREAGKQVDLEVLRDESRRAVMDSVKQQAAVGIDVVNDGEQGKSGWSSYVNQRLSGFDGEANPGPAGSGNSEMYPEYFAKFRNRQRPAVNRRTACNGPVGWKDFGAVENDITAFKAALKNVHVEEAFVPAASAVAVANGHQNQYYPNRDAYLQALSNVMEREYKAVVDAGFILQIDTTELGSGLRKKYMEGGDIQGVRKELAELIEVLNYSTRNIPVDKLRLHICRNRFDQPRDDDVELKHVVDIVLTARPQAINIPSANARYDHEWKVWKDTKLPTGKILIAGVADQSTNIIAHPEGVADRLVRYASVVGRENLMAGLDCGYGLSPYVGVDSKIQWAKLKTMSEGAVIASKELWKK